jgi:hypothetical protein
MGHAQFVGIREDQGHGGQEPGGILGHLIVLAADIAARILDEWEYALQFARNGIHRYVRSGLPAPDARAAG